MLSNCTNCIVHLLTVRTDCRTKWKGWSPLQHKLFPKDLKRAVSVMLLCQNRFVHDCDLEHEDEADDRPKGMHMYIYIHFARVTVCHI